MDSETEAVMQDIIDTIFKDCTVLAVMHRLDHVNRYDKVMVMVNGAVVEYGEPAMLAAGNTRFASLYRAHRQ